MIRILLVDDQKSIRERLKSLLETEADFDIVGMVDNGYDAIEQVKLLLPDVVLMDMEMPDIDGVLATKIISQSSLTTKILVLSSHDSDEYVARSIYAGANGYILKGAPAQEICDAVRFVNRGYMQIAPGLFEKFVPNKANAGKLAGKSQAKNAKLSDRFEYPAGLELTGINYNRSAASTTELDRSSELTVDDTSLPPSRKSIGRYQLAGLIFAGLLGLTLSVYLVRNIFKKPANSPSETDKAAQLHNLPFPGKIKPLQITKINATFPGSIVALHVKIGQAVQFGDRLLTIRQLDSKPTNQANIIQPQQVIPNQKQIAFAEVSQVDRRQIGVRLQQLQRQEAPLISPKTILLGQKSKIPLTIVNITAPSAATAIEVPVSVGDRVFVGTKLITLTNPKKLKIGVDVESQAATLLKIGYPAIVKVGMAMTSQELVGTIANIVPQPVSKVDPLDRQSRQHVEVEFTNPKPTTLIGRTGTVYFPK